MHSVLTLFLLIVLAQRATILEPHYTSNMYTTKFLH